MVKNRAFFKDLRIFSQLRKGHLSRRYGRLTGQTPLFTSNPLLFSIKKKEKKFPLGLEKTGLVMMDDNNNINNHKPQSNSGFFLFFKVFSPLLENHTWQTCNGVWFYTSSGPPYRILQPKRKKNLLVILFKEKYKYKYKRTTKGTFNNLWLT